MPANLANWLESDVMSASPAFDVKRRGFGLNAFYRQGRQEAVIGCESLTSQLTSLVYKLPLLLSIRSFKPIYTLFLSGWIV